MSKENINRFWMWGTGIAITLAGFAVTSIFGIESRKVDKTVYDKHIEVDQQRFVRIENHLNTIQVKQARIDENIGFIKKALEKSK